MAAVLTFEAVHSISQFNPAFLSCVSEKQLIFAYLRIMGRPYFIINLAVSDSVSHKIEAGFVERLFA